jgi:hypothetical protein
MMKTQQEKLKRQIVTLIKRSGLPVRTEYIVERVALPEHIILNDLLTELVDERRLIRSYTLLANGDRDSTYDLGK